MKQAIHLAKLLAISLVLCSAAMAEQETMGPFGEKILLRIGVMYVNQDTRIQLDGDNGVGVGVDLEDVFDLQEELQGVAQFSVIGAFAKRHRIGAMYYSLNRDASTVLVQDWKGDNVEISAGGQADTTLNVEIYDLSYGYSFIINERHRLEGTAGLFWAKLDINLDLQGDLVIDGEPANQNSAGVDASLNAPLPVFGLNYDYAIKPRWLLGTGFKYFALRTSKLSGSIVMVSVNTRYYFWDHFEVGGGLTIFDTGVEVDTGSFNGRFDWSFWGPQLFLGARF